MSLRTRISQLLQLAVTLSFIVYADSAAAEAPTIRLWISTSVNQNILSKVKEPFEKKTGIKIISVGDSTNTPATLYFKDVLDGKADAATTSVDFEDWVEQMRK